MTPTIGISDFFRNHARKEMGNSYCTLTETELLNLVAANWDKRKPGAGERKVLVPLPIRFPPVLFCPPKVDLVPGLPLLAEVFQRQEGEEPTIQNYVTPDVAEKYGYIEMPASSAEMVVYSASVLSENDGKRSTDCEWELFILLCTQGGSEPMHPLTMARNYLEKAGGTKGEYTATEFAEAIWHYYGGKRGVRVKEKR